MKITCVIDISDAGAGEFTLRVIAQVIEKALKIYTVFNARVTKIALGDNL